MYIWLFSTIIHTWHAFILQVGGTKGKDQGGLLNQDCIDVEHPADGNCNNGWKYWGGGWKEDNTIRLNCKGGGFIQSF